MKITPNPEFLDSIPLEVRARWANSLRTTTLGQHAGAMVNPWNSLEVCCLMVGHLEFAGSDKDRGEFLPLGDSEFSIVLGNPDPPIALTEAGNVLSASFLNDNERLSFEQIANLIHPENIT